jgi:hypothetical protein
MSPSARQSAEFLRKAAGFARRLGIRPRGDGQNEISLLFPHGSRIIGLPGREDTVRGFSAVSLLLVDEASRVRDEQYASVTPMLATSDGDMWLMSTPAGKRGFFYDTWTRGKGWVRVMAPATECSRIPGRFLAGERDAMSETMFRQEYLCEFLDADDALFREDDVRASLRPDVPALFEGMARAHAWTGIGIAELVCGGRGSGAATGPHGDRGFGAAGIGV